MPSIALFPKLVHPTAEPTRALTLHCIPVKCTTQLSWQVISLDLSALVAGAKSRGEYEERLRSALRNVEKSYFSYFI